MRPSPHTAPAGVAAHLAEGLLGALNAILYSSLLVAAAATGLTAATFLFWQQPMPPRLALLIFTATLFLYNLDSVLPYKYTQPELLSARKRWMLQHRRALLGVAIVSLGIAGWIFLFDGWLHLTPFLGHLAIISVLYSLPVLRRHGQRRSLRDVPLLKGFLIAYVWSAITVWLPALQLHQPLFSPVVLMLFARRFFFILSLTFVFDIRDYTKDRLSGTRTFPGLFGVRAAKLLALGALAVSAVLIPPGVSNLHVWVLTLPLLLTAGIIWQAKESRSDYYFALLADGVMLLQFLAVYWAAH